MSYLCKSSLIKKKKKSKLSEEHYVWIYWTYNNTWALDIHIHKCSTGIESLLLSSAERLKQSALAIRPRIHAKNRNNRKYIDKQCNSVVSDQKIMYEE